MIKCIGFLIFILIYPINLHAQKIFYAIRSGVLDSVKVVLEEDPTRINETHPAVATPLHYAVMRNNLEIAEFLIDKGARVDARDDIDATPLYQTAYSDDNLEMAKFLIERGADVNIETKFKMTILKEAARNAPMIADYLLDNGAVIPSPESDAGKDMLRSSAQNGVKRLFDRLISMGANIRGRDDLGNSLLHKASSGNQVDIINRLINSGLEVNYKNLDGWTPLHFAAEKGCNEAAVILIDKGADIDARTLDGNTAFNLAVELENSDVADFLSDNGAEKSFPEFPELSGKFFDQSPPGKTAEQFAKGIISSRYDYHGCVTFSLDGKEAYWAVIDFGKEKSRLIMESRIENGHWSYPKPAFFSEIGNGDDVPFISPDGQKFLFVSARPLESGGEAGKENIWMMERNGDNWSSPHPLPQVINSIEEIHHQVTMDRHGNLYFGARAEDSFGSLDIYCTKYENGSYREPVNLGPMVNGSNVEYTPYIAPDGSYLIFSKYKTVGWSLFISYLKDDGSWTEAKELSDTIGFPGEMDAPIVTRDGKQLFFLGGKMLQSNRIYWIDASFIEDLKPDEIKK